MFSEPVRFQFTLYKPILLYFVWNYLKYLHQKVFAFRKKNISLYIESFLTNAPNVFEYQNENQIRM